MIRVEPPDDLEIARAQKNDSNAMKSVLEKTSPYVLNLCKSWCRPPLESEDVAQESLICIANKLSKFESRSAYFTWVYSVTYRTFLDALRKETRRNKIAKIENFDDSRRLIEEQKSSMDELFVEETESIEMLSSALEAIGELHSEIMILIDVKQEPYAKVASDLGIPIGTVRSRLARARIRLRDELSKNGTNTRSHNVSNNEDTK